MKGIIPAGAGLTSRVATGVYRDRDHPRGCGAHLRVNSVRLRMPGSSPRVRGSLFANMKKSLLAGIIPAGAGLTPLSRITRMGGGDHPRGCGAHCGFTCFALSSTGSSPRVRGSPAMVAAPLVGAGIIPAGAGLTVENGAVSSNGRDHPRGCGAHTKKSQQLRHSLLLWLPESFTFKYSYRISHLVYSFVSAVT